MVVGVTSPGAEATMTLDRENPVNTTGLPVSLKVEVTTVPERGRAGVANEGFWGVPIQPATSIRRLVLCARR